MMRRIVFVIATVIALCCIDNSFAQDAKIKALIVDGQNNHNWRGTTPVLKDILEKSGRFTVDVATSPTKKDKEANKEEYLKNLAGFKPAFEKYDVVVSNYNSEETGDYWSEATQKAFEKFVADGGGFVSYHAADNSFPKWEEYNKMTGVGGWGNRGNVGSYFYWKDGKGVLDSSQGRGGSHGPQWAFLIEVRNTESPITKGFPKTFRHCKDELYDTLRGPAKDITILATAYADKSEHNGSDRDEPMLMVIPYGKGRVFHTTLGHDVQMLKSVSFIVTFLRGTEWAATGKVTIPIPDDMPGTDEPKFRD
ncbi:MAG: ThuA domain-containing protein [Planctomycetaceae bacterium]|jgi:type 1 glutamine amidotransferase|nr:ThuA domain-containing protein [Planctomycetaceae bacterium]